jgi:hypothetical protein
MCPENNHLFQPVSNRQINGKGISGYFAASFGIFNCPIRYFREIQLIIGS